MCLGTWVRRRGPSFPGIVGRDFPRRLGAARHEGPSDRRDLRAVPQLLWRAAQKDAPRAGPASPSRAGSALPAMKVHLIDGTYELFRNYYGAPPKKTPGGREIGATLGVLRSLLALLAQTGTTHVACAFDHVVESFRNDLFPGYTTREGVAPEPLR